MSLTLGLTGMDPATETALKAAFAEANERLGGRWRLLPETDAEHVMVDMDSMYGPMSWLRLHAAGKRVIGLTTASRTQTDFRLGRPFDSSSFCELLRQVAVDEGADPGDAQAGVEPAEAPAADPAPASDPQTDEGVAGTEAAIPAEDAASAGSPETTPADVQPEDGALEAAAAEGTGDSQTDAASEPASVAEPEPEPVTQSPQRDPAFADWLVPGVLTQRVRYRRDSGPTLLIDPATHSYHGPGTLKPFAAYFEGVVRREDFTAVADAAWATESAAAGAAQPLLRLQWLGGLLAGKGRLLPGNDPEGRYKLGKWPQTEREYPRHFRIATAMMKGPATLAEIAEASGMPIGDVADFVNANLVTGFAEFVPEAPPEPVEEPKPTGLFGRLRGR